MTSVRRALTVFHLLAAGFMVFVGLSPHLSPGPEFPAVAVAYLVAGLAVTHSGRFKTVRSLVLSSVAVSGISYGGTMSFLHVSGLRRELILESYVVTGLTEEPVYASDGMTPIGIRIGFTLEIPQDAGWGVTPMIVHPPSGSIMVAEPGNVAITPLGRVRPGPVYGSGKFHFSAKLYPVGLGASPDESRYCFSQTVWDLHQRRPDVPRKHTIQIHGTAFETGTEGNYSMSSFLVGARSLGAEVRADCYTPVHWRIPKR